MWMLLTRYCEPPLLINKKLSSRRQKNSIFRQYLFALNDVERSIRLNYCMFYCILSAIFVMFLVPQNAFALNSISIVADKITYNDATLYEANIALDLTGNDIAIVQAQTLEYGNAKLDNAHITVDLKANTTVLVKAKHILAYKMEAKNSTIYLDYRQNIEQPSVTFYSDIRQMNDPLWSSLQINCLIPKKAKVELWQCPGGLFNAARTSIPFTVTLLPKPNALDAQINFTDANFSDESGLHAGDKLTGIIKLSAQLETTQAKPAQRNANTSAIKKANSGEIKKGKNGELQKGNNIDIWRWQGHFNWTSGELFWQPFYFGKAGNEFKVAGTYSAPILNIEQANLKINEIGNMTATAELNTKTLEAKNIVVTAKDVDFAGLYNVVLKPMAEKSAFGNLKVSGRADWKFNVKDLQPMSFELNLRDANIEDLNGKFDLQNINAHIPWDYEEPKNISIHYDSGHLLKIPLRTTKLNAEINRYALTTPNLTIPILDGALEFQDVSAAYLGQNWVWHLKMNLQPITMNQFSKALGWPEMKGKINGQIPLITYANKQLNMQGQMQFNMFNGMIAMRDLKIDDPLGVVPRLNASFTMRDIDLGDLTRTFNFGAIEGKLEGNVTGLRLENWKPVRMDATIQTADGKHLKKISQRAVENITAFGGEGTAKALQRTFLRFFKEFNYEKIGLSCQLRQDICKMGGVESTPTGYVIVKGKGAPTVNVNGYTGYVSLSDLIARIKRITDGNTKMIVQ